MNSRHVYQIGLSLFVCWALSFCAAAQGDKSSPASNTTGSLFAIANKKRALLIVYKSNILEVGNNERSIIKQAIQADPRPTRRNKLAYATIARKLNEYIRKYHSMSAVQRLDDADYIIFFNLLEIKWPLGSPYPYGELYVILKGEKNLPENSKVLWKSAKSEWAGDGVKSLIKQLRMFRGED